MSDRERFRFVGRHPDANGVPWLIWASDGPSVYFAQVERLFWDRRFFSQTYWELNGGRNYEPGEDAEVIDGLMGVGR